MLEHMRDRTGTFSTYDILKSIKTSPMWFKLMFVEENDCKASQIQDFIAADKTLFCF